MVRLADPRALEAHQARFDLGRWPREGLDPVDARRLDALLDRPYESLDARDVAHALDLVERGGLAEALFPYFLPAALRRPPYRDTLASERLLAGLFATRGRPEVADWGPEIEETLVRWLVTRPLRGGDDPVDLWLSDAAARRHELEAARRLPARIRMRASLGGGWVAAREGPIYPRVALLLFHAEPERAVERFLSWESSEERNLVRVAVEVLFHAAGEGWRPDPAALAETLDVPARLARLEDRIAHEELDVALGAAATAILLAPRRGRELRARVAPRVAALDASDSDRFVLPSRVRRLLTGT